jgi:ribosomal protein S18 acetylase RimI-like enzyme
MTTPWLVIEPLNDTHHRPGFRCGVDALDTYLKRQANQDIKRRINRVFVARWPDNQRVVVGYYSLSALSVEHDQLPTSLSHKLPRYPIPCALIGRLAVDKPSQGMGIGRLMLADAIKRIQSIQHQIAIYALIVDALDDNAVQFYQRYGFRTLSKSSKRMFLPLRSLTETS